MTHASATRQSFVPGSPLAVLVLTVALVVGACERSASARAGHDVVARWETDSARGDSAALASLPPALEAAFSVRASLTPEALRDTASARCERVGAPNIADVRRRLRVHLADSSRSVLYVRATRGDTLQRVELVRRDVLGAQRGFIWDATTDVLQSLVWRAGRRRPEVSTLPRGGPAPRALRALGRRLLTLPCTGVAPSPSADS